MICFKTFFTIFDNSISFASDNPPSLNPPNLRRIEGCARHL